MCTQLCAPNITPNITQSSTPDSAKAEAFADGLIDTLNKGAMGLMLSIGHRTGLFDALENGLPLTSQELADKAGLNERYVREWLGAMVTGRIIEYSAGDRKYNLPQEHTMFLTRNASPDNIAVYAQYIGLLGRVEDEVIDCFYHGGGVPYERYPRFHEVMAEDSGQTVVSSLVEHILPLAPGLVDKLEQGIRVLDFGCGKGLALNLMAKRFPNSQFVGLDLSTEAVELGRKEAKRNGLTNLTFEQQDMTHFDQPQAYDLITAFDAVHDQKDPSWVLASVARALRPDGVFLMQDIAGSSHLENNLEHPIAPLLYTLSCMHCMTVSLAQDGAGLGTLWGEEMASELLQQAGFNDVEVHRLAHDFQNAYFVARLGERS